MDAGIPDNTIDELTRVELMLSMKEASVEVCTVWLALIAMKLLRGRRNQAAADWRQETRRIGKRAEDTGNRLAETQPELAGMKKRVDMTTGNWARCRC